MGFRGGAFASRARSGRRAALVGGVCVVAALTGGSGARAQTYRYHAVLKSGDIAPGTNGGSFTRFSEPTRLIGPSINERGDLAFVAEMSGGDAASGAFFAAASPNPAAGWSVAPVLLPGRPVSGGGTIRGQMVSGTGFGLTQSGLTDTGEVLIRSLVGKDFENALFLADTGAAPPRLLASTDPTHPASLPPVPLAGTLTRLGDVTHNGLRNDGTVSFIVDASVDGVNVSGTALLAGRADALRPLLAVDQRPGAARIEAPGTGGGYMAELQPSSALNERGDLAFGVYVGREGTDDWTSAVYTTTLDPGAGLTYVAGTGTPIAKETGAFLGANAPETVREMADDGTILLRGDVRGGRFAAFNGGAGVSSLLLARPGAGELEFIAGRSLPAPAAVGGTYGTFSPVVAMDERGRVLFYSNVNSVTTSGAIFQYENGVVTPLIKVGDPLFGSTVTRLRIGPDALNGQGQFAFLYSLMSGEEGIAFGVPLAAVPEPGAAPLAAPTIAGVLAVRIVARRRSRRKSGQTH